MNTGRGAGAQFGLEGRARAAVLATADEIRPDDVPPEPAWRPDEAARPVSARRADRLLRRLRDLGLRLPRPGPAPLAAFAGYVLRRYGGLGAAEDGEPRSSLGLRAGERAVWTGRARARWAWPVAALLAAAGALVGAMAAQWGTAVPLLAAGVLTLGFTAVRVTVAARGVTVDYGPLGLRLTRIPLRRIASATAVQRTEF